MIKAVLFDLDGTLIDTNGLVIQSFKYTLKNCLGMDVLDSEIVSYFGEPLAVTLERYDKENVEHLIEVYREYNEGNHDSLTNEIEDALRTLKELRERKIFIAVVTSKRRNMAERGLKLFGLDTYVDVMITPEDTIEHKPNAAPALEACRRLGIEPYEALMVGDSHFDILCGKNAGCSTAVVEYTALSLESILKHQPDYCIKSLMDVLSITAS